MGDIRLIATDLDWTYLLRGDPTEKNKQAVQRARQQGVYVIPCTARPWAMCDTLMQNLDFDGYAVTSNGAAVVDIQTGRANEPCPLKREWLRPIVEHILSLGYLVDLFCGDWIHSLDGVRTDAIAQNLLENKKENPIYSVKIRTFSDREEWLKQSEDITEMIRIQVPIPLPMPKEIQEFIDPIAPFVVTSSYKGHWDIGHPEASKEKALEKVCGWLGIDREQVMAIGDSDNDIGMIRWAGTGVAMENADECVKQTADYVTGRFDEDGFADAVHRLVLEA